MIVNRQTKATMWRGRTNWLLLSLIITTGYEIVTVRSSCVHSITGGNNNLSLIMPLEYQILVLIMMYCLQRWESGYPLCIWGTVSVSHLDNQYLRCNIFFLGVTVLFVLLKAIFKDRNPTKMLYWSGKPGQKYGEDSCCSSSQSF